MLLQPAATQRFDIFVNTRYETWSFFSIEFVWFEMSTAIGVGRCFECSESDVEFGMSSMWKTRRIVLTLANVSAQ